MSDWTRCEDRLPELDVPVWIWDPEVGQPVIGVRGHGDDGWIWYRADSDYWWSRGEGWRTNGEDWDDDHPTHWAPLPVPPAAEGVDHAG